ncbi:MAG: PilZ domain-containing protein [Deltaproteobacteria bacterium]|jgi:c-di-GMP-binding flagellar brake protein YcgR/predicted RNA-binding Zn-ribbon protein involved in translation (DUF1610 family)
MKRMVTCSNCGASGKVDISDFKQKEVKLLCPKCGEKFKYVIELRDVRRIVPLPIVQMLPYGSYTNAMNRKGILLDLSLGGMRVRVDRNPPSVGERLKLIFSLPGIVEEVRAGGEIVWVRPVENEEAHEFGVEFFQLDECDRKTIGFFIMR